MLKEIIQLKEKVLLGAKISREEAVELSGLKKNEIPYLLAAGAEISEKFFNGKVEFCSIINARSGACSEDCSFCAQSVHNQAEVDVYSLKTGDKILERAKRMEEKGASHFGLVTSGPRAEKEEFIKILEILGEIKVSTDLKVCASLGLLEQERAEKLVEVGLDRYNHNLETSQSYFPSVCSTHSYSERVETIRNVSQAGIEVCSGGILGLGEDMKDRIELAFTLRELEVDTVALNILNPVPGTPLSGNSIPPLEALKTISLFRFIFPETPIKVCGGRETGLRDLQPLAFLGGATGMLMGDYLTTEGRSCREDIQMVEDLGLEVCGSE